MTIKMSLDITWYRWYLLWFSQWKLDMPTFITTNCIRCPTPPLLFSPHVSESKTVLDCGLYAVDSGFQLLDPGPLSVERGFRIPNPTILESTWKNFWIPLLATINRRVRNTSSTREVRPGPVTNINFLLATSTHQKQKVMRIDNMISKDKVLWSLIKMSQSIL